MDILQQVNRINGHVALSFMTVAAMGGKMPPSLDIANLASTITTIPSDWKPLPSEASYVLSENTPAVIKRVADMGMATHYWREQDTIDIQLLDGNTLTFAISDFYHDEDVSGKRLPMTFWSQNLLYSENWTHSNNNPPPNLGFYDMAAGHYILNDFWTLLPRDWRDVITPVVKEYNTTDEVLTREVPVFVPNNVELFGTASATILDGLGSRQYSTFRSQTGRVRRLNNGAGEAVRFGTSSRRTNENRAVIANAAGVRSDASFRTLVGWCVGFCI